GQKIDDVVGQFHRGTRRRRPCLFSVAQIANLSVSARIVAVGDDFRTAAVCGAPAAACPNLPGALALVQSLVPPQPLRLVLRTQPRSAVSPIANRQGFGGVPASRPERSPARMASCDTADWQSALQIPPRR